jgi:hypothetical protein
VKCQFAMDAIAAVYRAELSRFSWWSPLTPFHVDASRAAK